MALPGALLGQNEGGADTPEIEAIPNIFSARLVRL
jgi:hypothetical protein